MIRIPNCSLSACSNRPSLMSSTNFMSRTCEKHKDILRKRYNIEFDLEVSKNYEQLVEVKNHAYKSKIEIVSGILTTSKGLYKIIKDLTKEKLKKIEEIFEEINGRIEDFYLADPLMTYINSLTFYTNGNIYFDELKIEISKFYSMSLPSFPEQQSIKKEEEEKKPIPAKLKENTKLVSSKKFQSFVKGFVPSSINNRLPIKATVEIFEGSNIENGPVNSEFIEQGHNNPFESKISNNRSNITGSPVNSQDIYEENKNPIIRSCSPSISSRSSSPSRSNSRSIKNRTTFKEGTTSKKTVSIFSRSENVVRSSSSHRVEKNVFDSPDDYQEQLKQIKLRKSLASNNSPTFLSQIITGSKFNNKEAEDQDLDFKFEKNQDECEVFACQDNFSEKNYEDALSIKKSKVVKEGFENDLSQDSINKFEENAYKNLKNHDLSPSESLSGSSNEEELFQTEVLKDPSANQQKRINDKVQIVRKDFYQGLEEKKVPIKDFSQLPKNLAKQNQSPIKKTTLNFNMTNKKANEEKEGKKCSCSHNIFPRDNTLPYLKK